jgi:hypothetical protein
MLNKILGSIFVIIILLFGIDYVYMESTDKKCNIDCTCEKSEDCICGEQTCGYIKDKYHQNVYFYGRYW